MDNILRTFYGNKTQKDVVKAFMIDTLGQIAIDKSFKGESTTGIQDARALIEKMFDRLDEMYAKIEEPIINNSR